MISLDDVLVSMGGSRLCHFIMIAFTISHETLYLKLPSLVQEQLLKRIESLEHLLAEERKKSDRKGDDSESDLHLREREILQQEVSPALL